MRGSCFAILLRRGYARGYAGQGATQGLGSEGGEGGGCNPARGGHRFWGWRAYALQCEVCLSSSMAVEKLENKG